MPLQISRAYDGYGQLLTEAVTAGGQTYSSVTQSWDAAGRRASLDESSSALPIPLFAYQHRADGLLTQVTANSQNYGFGYADSGLLTTRTNPFRNLSVDSHDAAGRILQQTTTVGGTAAMIEAMTWRDDSRLSTYAVSRSGTGAWNESRAYTYNARGQLLSEGFSPAPSLSDTLTYVFDGNTPGVGVRTDAKAGTGAPGAWEVSATAIDTLARVTQDQINAVKRVLTASGFALGADHVDVFVDGVSQGRANHPGWADPVGAWSMNLNLAAGSHTLTVNAVHPSHQYTATASSTFTIAQSQGGNVTSAYDAEGDVTSRTWDSGLVQTLTWDAFGRLIKVAQRDSTGNGYDWSAVYDGLGRRLKTTQQAVTANAANGTATVTTSIYDPQTEFLEIGVAVDSAKAWKVYGPDLNGRYGWLQGTGGLEATIVATNDATKGVINDQFGNGVASVSGGQVTWFTTRVGSYGPLPGSQTETLTDITRVVEATTWRSRRIDSTGFIYLGARYYEPTSGRFLSADPTGHAASMSLYDYANGDPLNYFDPDGRLGKDPNNARWSSDKCAALMRQIAAETSLALKELTTLADILNAAPAARDYLNNPLDYADTTNNLSDLTKTLSTRYSEFLETARFGAGIKLAGNLVATAGIVANAIELGNSAVDLMHDRSGAGWRFRGAAAGYTLGVGLLAANLHGAAAVSYLNPIAAGGSILILGGLVAYDVHEQNVNAEEVAQTADQLSGYIRRNAAAATQNLSDFNVHCK